MSKWISVKDRLPTYEQITGYPMDMQFDKNIPIPPVHNRGGKKGFWLLSEIGDSMMFKTSSARHNCSDMGKKYGRKFVSRTVTENGITGIRVWRVE